MSRGVAGPLAPSGGFSPGRHLCLSTRHECYYSSRTSNGKRCGNEQSLFECRTFNMLAA